MVVKKNNNMHRAVIRSIMVVKKKTIYILQHNLFITHYCWDPEHKLCFFFIVLGFNDTSTLEGHFVSSPREREKRDRRESRGDER